MLLPLRQPPRVVRVCCGTASGRWPIRYAEALCLPHSVNSSRPSRSRGRRTTSSSQLVASVVLAAGPAKEFDYLVPDGLREAVELGRRVKAPFGPGNRLVVGYCVRLEDRPAGRRKLKPLHSVLDQRSLLSPAMLRL